MLTHWATFFPSIAAVVEEAKTAFIMNAALFTALDSDEPEDLLSEQVFAAPPAAQKTYSIAQVISVIAAGMLVTQSALYIL